MCLIKCSSLLDIKQKDNANGQRLFYFRLQKKLNDNRTKYVDAHSENSLSSSQSLRPCLLPTRDSMALTIFFRQSLILFFVNFIPVLFLSFILLHNHIKIMLVTGMCCLNCNCSLVTNEGGIYWQIYELNIKIGNVGNQLYCIVLQLLLIILKLIRLDFSKAMPGKFVSLVN